MRWLVLILVLVAAFVIAIFAAGAMLPLGHVDSVALKLNQSPVEVWQAIANHADDPKWRPDLTSIERLPDRAGHPVWKETYKNGMKLILEDTESKPPNKLVRQVQDVGNMFTGRWEFKIAAIDMGGGSRVKITEYGEVPNPFFRFMSRFVFGDTKSMEQYLTALAAKFGEKAKFGK